MTLKQSSFIMKMGCYFALGGQLDGQLDGQNIQKKDLNTPYLLCKNVTFYIKNVRF